MKKLEIEITNNVIHLTNCDVLFRIEDLEVIDRSSMKDNGYHLWINNHDVLAYIDDEEAKILIQLFKDNSRNNI